MSLFQIPLSFLGERIGELTVIAAGTFGLAGGFLVLGRVHTFLAILISLIFAKATGGGQHGLSSSLLSRVFETSGRRAAMGTYNFSGDMGKVCLHSHWLSWLTSGVGDRRFQFSPSSGSQRAPSSGW